MVPNLGELLNGESDNGICKFKIQFKKKPQSQSPPLSKILRFSIVGFPTHTKILYCFSQEPIESRIRTQILSELKDLGNISDLLSTLEMAIGFLSTAGGDPERKIFDYLKNVLHLSDGKSNLKSKKVCNIAWFYWSISHD